jgi:predicted ATPase
VLAIAGEAGIGKSRLARELAAEAERRGARVILGISHEAVQTQPLRPWADALRRGGLTEGVDVATWPAAWRREIVRLFPEIDPAAPPEPPREDSALHLLEGLGRLVIGAATTRPLVIVIEDVHWADTLSVRFLSFLGHRIDLVPILIAVTVRDEDAVDVPAVGRAFADLDRESRLVRMVLPPLTREVVDAALARLQEAVWASSGGNAFVVVEMVHAFHAAERGGPALPRKVHELIADRLDRLGEHAQELASLAAVMSADIDFTLLTRASGLSESAAVDGLEELVRRRVLHGVGDRFAFVHDRVRDVALHRVPEARRQLLHRQVAEAAEALYTQGAEGLAAILARHYRAAEM